jgi:hypothetical protein
MTMPFGKYKGTEIAELPSDYLLWMLALDDLREPLRSAVLREAVRRNEEVPIALKHNVVAINLKPEELQLARRLFDAGYKTLARALHPDLGGDVQQMQDLNLFAENVRQQFVTLEGGMR